MRELSRTVRAGKYRHGPVRKVLIPKPKGGHRTLKLANLTDRVLAAAVNAALSPYWETVFLPRSFGFRPGRGCWDLLAALEAEMAATGRWVLAVDDVRKAFDEVRVADLLADHAAHISDPELLALVGAVLRGSDGPARVVGIDQGAAYSPTGLNVLLHHAHDLGAERGPWSWFRYADNLAYLTRTMSEGAEILQQVREILGQAGLALKGEDGPPKDLARGETAQLLGYTLSRGDHGLRFTIGTEALNRLETHLRQALDRPIPSQTAHQAVMGWVASAGPAYESDRDEILERITTTLARYGYPGDQPGRDPGRVAGVVGPVAATPAADVGAPGPGWDAR